MVTTNTFSHFVAKLIEIDSIYRTIDTSDQEIGLKVLVSLCKRYERCLGTKHTLQTWVWYNLAGIENFFEEICSDYNSMVCRGTSVKCSETILDDRNVDNDSKVIGDVEEETVVSGYTVKSAEDFNGLENEENENDLAVLGVYEVKQHDISGETDQRFGHINDENIAIGSQVDSDYIVDEIRNYGKVCKEDSRTDHRDCNNIQSKEHDTSKQRIQSDRSTASAIVKSCNDQSYAVLESESVHHSETPEDITGCIQKADFKNQSNNLDRQEEKKRKQTCPQKKEEPLRARPTRKHCYRNLMKSIPHPDNQREVIKHDNIEDINITEENEIRNGLTILIGENSNFNKTHKPASVKQQRREGSLNRLATKARLMEALEMNPIKKSKCLKRKDRSKRRRSSLLKLHTSYKGTAKKKLTSKTLMKSSRCKDITDTHSRIREVTRGDVLGTAITSEKYLEMNNVYQNNFEYEHKQPNKTDFKLNTSEKNEYENKEHGQVEQEGSVSCQFCGRRFSRPRILYSHYRSHPEGRLACLKCGVFHKQAEDLKAHMEQHAEQAKYFCNRCRISFEGRQNFDTLMASHKTNYCRFCQISLPSQELLWKHRLQVHSEKNATNISGANSESFVCSCCGKIFKKQTDLEAHSRLHTGELPYECSVCKVFFRTNTALNRHRKTNKHCLMSGGQEVEKRFLCQVCGKAYFKQHGLQRHMRIHRSEKQQSCRYCDFRCQEVNNLKRHMSLHFESERNYVCEICGAAFHAKKTLETHHIYKHSNERKFNCSQCSYSFKSKSALRRHEKVHSQDKEHQCVCGMAFRRICNLRRHLRLIHGNEELLPPVKHVATLDFHKKVPLSKTDLVKTAKQEEGSDSLHDNLNNTPLNMSECTEVDSEVAIGSDDGYNVSSPKTSVAESSNHFFSTELNVQNNVTTSSYSHEEIVDNTTPQVSHQHLEVSDTAISHEVSQPFLNREMFFGNFCFPHLAMGTNSISDQHPPILPHIHMLQNSEHKDSLSLHKPTPKLTFTYGNHWQKLVHNETESSYRDIDHTIRFPNNLVDNSVRIAPRLNQDQRGALPEDIYTRLAQEELTQRLLSDPQRLEQHIATSLTTEKSDSDTSCAYPYRVTYSSNNHYTPETDDKTSTSEQSEESAYLQSRREMAAESLAQMAALSMDASFQQQTAGVKSQLL